MFTRGSYYNRQPIDPAQLLGNRAGASWELPEPKEKKSLPSTGPSQPFE